MRHLILITLLFLAAPFSWGETWTCAVNTYVGAEQTSRGNAGTGSELAIYSVEGGIVRYYDNLMTLDIVHNDERSLIAVSPERNPQLRDPQFTYLLIDKVNRRHVFDLVTTRDDRSRDEGDCEHST